MEKIYTTDTLNVIFEELEDEVVVINLKSGCYYSLNQSASWIWKWLVCGYSVDHICECTLLKEDCLSRKDEIRKAIDGIVAQFLEEAILFEAEPSDATQDRLNPPQPNAMPSPFQRPLMTRHAEIQEMLQLDPIHEVTDLGWPNRK